ncbi:MAG TPA: plasmid stabilization protein [Lentisphaeria bacterium]|nr:plasmid stabilization protein [Lentisphaeria bacterium]
MPEAIFHPEAENELYSAAEYYEKKLLNLGVDFLAELDRTVDDIVTHPTAWAILEFDVRKHLVNRFPYAVLYLLSADCIEILAVAHQRRQPGYWHHRRG